MKKYLAGLAAVSVAGGAAPTLDSVQAAPEQNTQKAATQTVQASAPNTSSYTVNADVLHVRAGSSTSQDIISRVYNGQSLNVIGEENGWFKINHNGKTGFVSGEFVSKKGATNSNVSTTGGKNKVTADVLRVRTAPNTSSSVSGRVYEGQTLNVIGQENGWVKINHNGQTGYVSGQFVSGVSANTGATNDTNQQTVQPASGNYTVNVSSLRVRTGPSTSHTTVASITKGQVVQVVGEVQDWFKINYAGQAAYISKDYVTKGGSNENGSQGNNQNNNQNNNVTVQTGGTYVVNATSLRVRTGPAAYHSVIGGVLNGTTLNVVGSEGSWFKVNYQGKTGFVSGEFVKFVKGGTATPEQPKQPEKPNQGAIGDYYINASALNVRSGEGTNYRIIGALSQGQKVQVISENSGWSKINYNGQNGYIGTRFLSKTPVGGAVDKPNNNNNQNNNNQNNNNTGNNSGDTSSLLAYAKSMQGVPYVWGGTSANGVDCSGYIYHVFKKFGHNISRQSVAGYWSSLPKTSSPQPGDLIYFQNTYKAGPSHMGIYLGGGSFIQSGDKGVAIASLSNSYWKSHFLGYTKAP
ncbi:C40 family peptidase [Bacillus toyonensis]|uniref:C40 family peptidase n=1 Tax=Bacillus toyonensis TaxID=155322 RepID=UPI000B43726C|nr:C40 family peptidase [Bacillus toyonensis]OTX31954.1 peptidase M24 [Bacillus thuringiensis serovar malayensis]OUB07517.1 peptidase M24 [Bacillus thuringiensis serovar shandongiensis]MBF7148355.1 SH3 domain-containing protein [Bacillus toyonensis]MBX0354622.1 SH3 domain-containing protein [Bacillus toyonensis]MDM5258299.1 SH3 domain-containing protein [Bacillus toyonensis]